MEGKNLFITCMDTLFTRFSHASKPHNLLNLCNKDIHNGYMTLKKVLITWDIVFIVIYIVFY